VIPVFISHIQWIFCPIFEREATRLAVLAFIKINIFSMLYKQLSVGTVFAIKVTMFLRKPIQGV